MRILCTQTKDLRLLSFWDFFFLAFMSFQEKVGSLQQSGLLIVLR